MSTRSAIAMESAASATGHSPQKPKHHQPKHHHYHKDSIKITTVYSSWSRIEQNSSQLSSLSCFTFCSSCDGGDNDNDSQLSFVKTIISLSSERFFLQQPLSFQQPAGTEEAVPKSIFNNFVEMGEAAAVDGWFGENCCLNLQDSKTKTMRVAVRVSWTTNLPDDTSCEAYISFIETCAHYF